MALSLFAENVDGVLQICEKENNIQDWRGRKDILRQQNNATFRQNALKFQK